LSSLVPLLDEMFSDHDRFGTTYATVVVHEGRLVDERYGGMLEHWDRPHEPVDESTRLLSWSMAKSILHAAVGILVSDGALDLDAPAEVPAWRDDRDPRRSITLQQLLEMRDGLEFAEDYVDDRRSDVIEMLFGSGQADVAGYAASRPLAHPPGTAYNYSSGTSNIVARIVCDVIGGGPADCEDFLRYRLFEPIGMTSPRPRFDEAGTFIGSSYVYATARDFARFGYLYLRGGEWDGRAVLPAGWVDHGRRARSVGPDGRVHGAHWWVDDDEYGSFRASGYDGQSILCVPGLDLVVVRLGKTEDGPVDHLARWRTRVKEAVAGS
jgi:CubicO group peptidase (beta-lactamase class C family)